MTFFTSRGVHPIRELKNPTRIIRVELGSFFLIRFGLGSKRKWLGQTDSTQEPYKKKKKSEAQRRSPDRLKPEPRVSAYASGLRRLTLSLWLYSYFIPSRSSALHPLHTFSLDYFTVLSNSQVLNEIVPAPGLLGASLDLLLIFEI